MTTVNTPLIRNRQGAASNLASGTTAATMGLARSEVLRPGVEYLRTRKRLSDQSLGTTGTYVIGTDTAFGVVSVAATTTFPAPKPQFEAYQSFEGTDEVDIGGTDLWFSGAVGGVGTVKFDTAFAVEGSSSMRVTTSDGTATNRLVTHGPATKMYVSTYWMCDDPTLVNVTTLMNSGDGTNVGGSVRLNQTGFLRINDDVAASSVNSTLAIVANQWYRLDWTYDAVAQTQTLKIFTGANLNGSTADDTISTSYNNNAQGITQITRLRMGNTNNAGQAISYWYDAAAYSTYAMPAPRGVVSATATPTTIAAVTTFGTPTLTPISTVPTIAAVTTFGEAATEQYPDTINAVVTFGEAATEQYASTINAVVTFGQPVTLQYPPTINAVVTFGEAATEQYPPVIAAVTTFGTPRIQPAANIATISAVATLPAPAFTSSVAISGSSVAFGATGGGAIGSSGSTVLPAYPTGIAAGDLLAVGVWWKYPSATTISTPSGWSLQGSATAGTGTGVDTGEVGVTVFTKIATGSESGSLTINLSGTPNLCRAEMYRYRSSNAATTLTAAVGAADNTADATISAAAATDPGVRTGDLYLVFSAFNTSTTGITLNPAITQSGATLTVVSARRSGSSTNGDHIAYEAREFSASGSSTGPPTISNTSTGTPLMATVFLRIRPEPYIVAEAVTTFGAPTLATASDANITPSTIAAVTSVAGGATEQNPATILAVTSFGEAATEQYPPIINAVVTFGEAATEQYPPVVAGVTTFPAATMSTGSTVSPTAISGVTTVGGGLVQPVAGVASISAVTTFPAPTFTSRATIIATPISLNQVPDFDKWTLSGGATIDSDNVVTLPTPAAFAYIYVPWSDETGNWFFSAEVQGANFPTEPTFSPYTGAHYSSSYFGEDSTTPVLNNAGFTGNGNAQKSLVTTGVWSGRLQWTANTLGGPNIRYIRITVQCSTQYTGNGVMYRRPELSRTSQTVYTPAGLPATVTGGETEQYPGQISGATSMSAPTMSMGSTVTPSVISGVTSVAGGATEQNPPTILAVTSFGEAATEQYPAVISGATTMPAPTMSMGSTATPTVINGVTSFAGGATEQNPAPIFAVTTFGQATTEQYPPVVAGTTTFPAPTLSTGSTVTPSTIAVPCSFGGAFIQPAGTVTISGVTTFPAPTFTSSVTITPAVISSVGTVGGGATEQNPTVIPAVTTFGTPTFASSATITPGTISGTSYVFQPTDVTQWVDIFPAHIAATSYVFQPADVTQWVDIFPAPIGAVTTFGAPVSAASSTTAPTFIAATTSMPAPTMHTGSTATPATIAAPTSVGTPPVSTGTTYPSGTIRAKTWVGQWTFADDFQRADPGDGTLGGEWDHQTGIPASITAGVAYAQGDFVYPPLTRRVSGSVVYQGVDTSFGLNEWEVDVSGYDSTSYIDAYLVYRANISQLSVSAYSDPGGVQSLKGTTVALVPGDVIGFEFDFDDHFKVWLNGVLVLTLSNTSLDAGTPTFPLSTLTEDLGDIFAFGIIGGYYGPVSVRAGLRDGSDGLIVHTGSTVTPATIAAESYVFQPADVTQWVDVFPAVVSAATTFGSLAFTSSATATPARITGLTTFGTADLQGATTVPGATVSAVTTLPAPTFTSSVLITPSRISGTGTVGQGETEQYPGRISAAATFAAPKVHFEAYQSFEGADEVDITNTSLWFTTGVTNTGGTVKFDTAYAADGASSMRTSTPDGLAVNRATSYGPTTKLYTSVYWRTDDPTPTNITSIMNSADVSIIGGTVRLNTAGLFRLNDDTSSSSVNGTLTAVANQWYRLDWTFDVTAQTQTLQIFTGANLNGSTPDDTITTSYNNNAQGLTQVTRWRLGVISNAGQAISFWYDAAAYSTYAMPAPRAVIPAAVSGAAISAVTTFGAPTVRAASTVTGAAISATTTLPAPTFTSSATVTPATIGSSGTVSDGSPASSATTIVATTSFGAPAVSGAVLVTPTSVTVLTTFGTAAPQAGTDVTGTTVGGVTTLGTPILHTGSITAVAQIQVIATVGGATPSTSVLVSPAGLGSTATIPDPTLPVTAGAGSISATITISTPGVSTSVLLAPTLITGAASVGSHIVKVPAKRFMGFGLPI